MPALFSPPPPPSLSDMNGNFECVDGAPYGRPAGVLRRCVCVCGGGAAAY